MERSSLKFFYFMILFFPSPLTRSSPIFGFQPKTFALVFVFKKVADQIKLYYTYIYIRKYKM